MSGRISNKLTTMLMLGASAVVLSSCVGGTTYGTGVTQEQQLVQDLQGMVSFGAQKKRKARIDYSARPDLVLPAKSAALPIPQEQVSSTSTADWPESPEQRLARIRGEAEEADPRSGEISLEEQRRKKVGTRIANGNAEYVDPDKDGHAAIDSLSDGSYKNAAMLKRQENTYSTVTTRKYLTEPPVEYRTPVSSAAIGDLGISEAEKDKRAEKAAKFKRENESGMWTEN